ncbi:phospholipid phosphatase [Bhargavaea beijingensis]|uniref:Phospholipid phosphatase n=1 Tax=Bhargavaea beijingensis TaxID=426756 RepID=A0ABX9ZE22_9BACL|nr:phospholipid phosphatase [Bhargavaea beijingensis]MCW1928032.1 phospholipid phosphatase [Bhargavaea beijingensis]RSK34260.1 phospholipid phosphatase [Bhargavaea beijingensis]
MDAYIFGGFALAYSGLLIGTVSKQSEWALMSVILLVMLSLVYDNGILALGTLIGEGALLEGLNAARFWLHAFVTPTLILFSLGAMRQAGIGWARRGWAALLFWAAAISAVIVEFVTVINGLELKKIERYGVLSYSSAEEASGPPAMILIVIAALLVAGIFLAWKAGSWWILAGTIAMAIGSMFNPDIPSEAATNLFELVLIASLAVTKVKLENRPDTDSMVQQ